MFGILSWFGVLGIIHFSFNLRHTKTIGNINLWKRTEAGAGPGAMKKESSGARTTLKKTNSSGSGAGAMFMKTRIPEPDLCHFYNGSTALSLSTVFLFFWPNRWESNPLYSIRRLNSKKGIEPNPRNHVLYECTTEPKIPQTSIQTTNLTRNVFPILLKISVKALDFW